MIPRLILFVSVFVLLNFPVCSQQSEKGNSALVIVDLQEHFTQGMLDTEDSEKLIDRVNATIETSRPEMEIIFIQALPRVLQVSFKGIRTVTAEHIELDPRLYRKKNDPVFSKKEPSAFSNQELKTFLEEHHIKRIYLAGMFVEQCLGATALEGVELGYEVILIGDAAAAKKPKKKVKEMEKLEKKGVSVVF